MAENEDSKKFDDAAIKAEEAFQKMYLSMTPEQKKGVTMLSEWWKAWFTTAGHRRLGRIVNKPR